MYNAMTSKKCPKCGTTVNVYTSMILTSNPPCYEWTCPNCGEKGYTSKGDVVPFDGEIRVVTGDGTIKAENMETPKSCNIPAPQFLQQGWECPKCGAILAPHQHYCPFCSPSEYGRSNWVVTTPVRVPLEQYSNPNPNIATSLGDKPKKSDSCTVTLGTRGNIRTWTLE